MSAVPRSAAGASASADANAAASGEIPILGVAGRPVLHSMSPVLFRELFRASGVKAAYTRVAAGSAVEALELFRALGMRGMNLTAPFKEEAAKLVDELSPEARALGAVNCLVPLDGGGILGANTDPAGVLGGLRARGLDPAGKRCLVLGAGGAGKAAAFALKSAGGEVTVANRTRSRADALASLLGCASAGMDELPSLAREAELIASTLASDSLPDPASWFPEGASPALIDADYKSGRLARYAEARGLGVATGADWLAGQALPAYELFMGRPFEAGSLGAGVYGTSAVDRGAAVAALAELLAKARRPYEGGRKIALIGLMGAGKTRSGSILAGMMRLPFVDSDKEIEAEAGATIPEIFAGEGESGFRAREARAIDRICSEPGPLVLATGGGAAASPAIAAILAERCTVVWLYVSPKTAARRARGGVGSAAGSTADRPLLAGGDPEARLAALEAERRGAYASCAELLVSSEGREVGEAAEVIHDEIVRLS